MSNTIKEAHKAVAKGTFWSLLGSVSTKFISFIYLIIIAWLISPEDIGTFYLALSIVSGIAIISDFGFSSAFSRYVPYFLGKKEDEKAYVLLGGGYVLSSILSLFFIIILFFGAGSISSVLKNDALEKPLQLFSLYLVINCICFLNSCFLQGRKKIKESAVITTVQNTLKLLFTLALCLLVERSTVSLVLAFVGSSIVALVLSFYYIRDDLAKINLTALLQKFSAYFQLYKEVVVFGLILSLVASLYALVGYSDRVLLSYFLPSADSAAAIGVYTVAIGLASVVTLFPSAIAAIFLPVISELYAKGDKKKMIEVSNAATRWVLFLIMPFTLVFIAFPDNMLGAFYGPAYTSGATVLALFTLGTFVRFLTYVHGYLLAAVRLIKIELVIALFAAFVNVALGFLLIPSYGMEGAAIASAISLTVVTILFLYCTKKLFGFTFPPSFYKPLVAGVIALALIFLLKGYALDIISKIGDLSLVNNEMANYVVNKLIKLAILGALFVFSCTAYAVALILMKAFAKDDIALISAGLRKARVPDEFVLLAERVASLE